MSGPRRRVLAVASGGGHWLQLVRVVAPLAADHDLAWVTVHEGYESHVPSGRFHVVNDATRWNKWGLVRQALSLAWIVLRERPDVVVSTGAAPGFFALILGRVLRARTVWIDSIANVEELSLSGKRAQRFADLWLTQWEHLAAPDGPDFEGSVL